MTAQPATCSVNVDYSDRVNFAFNRVTKSTAQICEVVLTQMLDQQLITLEGGNYKITNISPK
jgi:hypothetical protein